jgi:hypothetical protein
MVNYLSNEQKKKMISELQKLKDDTNKDVRKIIDLLKEYFFKDYPDVIKKENEAKAEKIINENNIDGYIYDYIKRTIADKYKIDCCNVSLNYIKAILFFEHIMKRLEESDNVNVERNMKIKEYREVYNLFKALASEENCDLSKHQKAIIITELTGNIQKELDTTEYHIRHITYANYIYDTFLIKYIEEYKNYL